MGAVRGVDRRAAPTHQRAECGDGRVAGDRAGGAARARRAPPRAGAAVATTIPTAFPARARARGGGVLPGVVHERPGHLGHAGASERSWASGRGGAGRALPRARGVALRHGGGRLVCARGNGTCGPRGDDRRAFPDGGLAGAAPSALPLQHAAHGRAAHPARAGARVGGGRASGRAAAHGHRGDARRGAHRRRVGVRVALPRSRAPALRRPAGG